MKKKVLAFALIAVLTTAFMPLTGGTGNAYAGASKVGVQTGPTKIFEGMAVDYDDITIYNDKIAVSFAVGSNNYWNMTKGSILDIGIRGAGGSEGDFGVDLVNDVELLGDLWTSTGIYNGVDLRDDVKVTSKVSEDGNSVSVTSEYRYWVKDADKDKSDDDALPLEIKQVYTLSAGDNFIDMHTEVTNPEENTVPYADMYTGYSISTNAAYMFGPYGFYPDVKTTGIAIGDNENVQEAFGKFVTTYKDDYAVSLIMDGSDSYKGSTGYKDIYKHQDLEPGETYEFDGEVVVSDKNETATVIDRLGSRLGMTNSDMVTVSGTIKDNDGKPVEGASIIAEKTGTYMQTKKSAGYTSGHVDGKVVSSMQPLVWDTTDADGKYSFLLPKTGFNDGTENIGGNGDYKYKFKIEAAGYTSQETEVMSITSNTTKDYKIQDGAQVKLTAKDQNGNTIPFRVEVSGVTPEIKTAGVSTFYSDALNEDDKYSVIINMSQAEDVTFTASYGKDFESKAKKFKTDVTSEGVEHEFIIKELVDPEAEGWYSVDNHQHADFGDGATTIEDLFRAQIAAKLDINLVADHDTRTNVYTLSQYAKENNLKFLSNMEVSPGWGHWGVLGVDYGKTDNDKKPIVDATTATPQDIIKTGHDKNAVVIMHHPYSDYGFLNNQDSVKGGHDEGWDGFDLLELQSTMDLSEMYGLKASDIENIDMEKLNKTIAAAGVTNMDAKALVTAMKFWNNGVPKYLSAGSDQHQATSTTLYPGIIREYAKLDKLSSNNYLDAITSGHAYVSCGPLLFPSEKNQFGDTIKITAGQKEVIEVDAQAVNGLNTITLFSNGVPVKTKRMYSDAGRNTIKFEVTPTKSTKWYSIIAVDDNGNYAASNPIWTSINTLDQTISVSKSTKTVKAKTVKKKAVYTSAVAVTGANSDVTFTKVSGSKKLTIDETSGKIKVAKKTKKGTYSIKVKVTAVETDLYNEATQTQTIKVRVK